jgi:hypothetical protein
MRAFILAALIAFLVALYTASSWASYCACGSGTPGDGISCSGGCGCVTVGNFCGCWCEHVIAAPPISYGNPDAAKDAASQPSSPFARALSKTTAECAARLTNAIFVDVKDASAEAIDIYMQALCERLQRAKK